MFSRASSSTPVDEIAVRIVYSRAARALNVAARELADRFDARIASHIRHTQI